MGNNSQPLFRGVGKNCEKRINTYFIRVFSIRFTFINVYDTSPPTFYLDNLPPLPDLSRTFNIRWKSSSFIRLSYPCVFEVVQES